ncbi:MAG: UDP-3-O-[3-hydroxymyristoyl] N-acetylglucosamine deacetylase [Bdellovibrionales bacterium]|nr:UDP-3-O-[3-hydroxymyristoyl] N-acetylglucosamine deacetylase [Bdellovibrionales bacterium]
MSQQKTILIVDDEENICKTLEGVFKDEGFETLIAHDGSSALQEISKKIPSLVLLDIWMPGMDGMDTLKEIKAIHPSLPVVMISGHATIATAIKATRLGASDFIEKPLDLETTLQIIYRTLGHPEVFVEASTELEAKERSRQLRIGDFWDDLEIDPVVFRAEFLKGRPVKQKTLASSTLVYGQGLHSGRKSGLLLEPLAPNSGIHFVGLGDLQAVPAHVEYVESTGFATTIKLGGTEAGTIEHLMSALHAYGISNVLVKCNGEVPVLDGSSREFCTLIEDVGIEEQAGDWFEIAIDKVYQVGEGEEFIKIEPADEFIIEYRLKYPEPVGEQTFTFTLGDIELYKSEISPARTFGFVKDIGQLQKMGLAQGGRFDNFVLYGEEGALNDSLRFSNEAVRHKILDAIGDLYLLGRPIRGKVTASMTGHSDNIELLKKIWNENLF